MTPDGVRDSFPAVTNGESPESSGPSLRLVLGGLSLLVLILGPLAYWRFTVSGQHFAEAMHHMDELGPTVDTEGCISAVLDWHEHCEADRNLCNHGVPRVLVHCLVGADRQATCDGLDLSSAKAQWVFQSCEERGTPCDDRKNCACASAYRTIDSFCRHGQEGVPL